MNPTSLAAALLLGFVCTGFAAETGPAFPRIANCYSVGLAPGNTEQDLEEIARFDLLIGGVWCNWGDEAQRARLAENVRKVKEKNPDIIILDFSSSAPYADPRDASFPESGWLLQPDGKYVDGWPGTRMINLTHPEVVDWLAARSAASLKKGAFDGTFIDCMGGGFDWWACNIQSGETYTIDADKDGKPDDRATLDRDWIAAKTELSRKVREAIGSEVPFMTNQAGDWGAPYMNGILLEDYLDYVLDGHKSWDSVMDDYLKWTRVPHKPNLTTIVSSSGVQPPFNPWQSLNQAGRDALLEYGRSLEDRMRFGLATTLMGDGYFAYDLHTRWRGQRWWYKEYDAPLGYPKAEGSKQPDGTWRREFDGGTAIVNPTMFDALVSFADLRQDVSSEKISKSFVIPSRDGRILIPSDGPERPGTLPEPEKPLVLRGPESMVEGRGRILCRLNDQWVAVLDPQGQVLELTDGETELLRDLRPFIVSDDRYRDFAYEDCAFALEADRHLRFSGKRTESGVALGYEQDVTWDESSLTVTYHWKALTDAHTHMWRHQLDFPVSQYADGSFEAGQTAGKLPVDRSDAPVLTAEAETLMITRPDGAAVTVSCSGKAGLVDERHYGVPAYRLGHSPANGDLKAGQEWEVSIKIEVD